MRGDKDTKKGNAPVHLYSPLFAGRKAFRQSRRNRTTGTVKFTFIFRTADAGVKKLELGVQSLAAGPPRSSFEFSEISTDFTHRQLLNIPLGKSTGLDGVSSRLIRHAAPVITGPLTYIYNLSLSTGIVPTVWKTAKVTPLHKDGDKNNCNNYRPISVIPSFMKILEKAIHAQVYSYLKEHNILNQCQSGFRPKHSCSTTLLHVTDTILSNMDKGLVTGAVFLDLKKAFDTVCHQRDWPDQNPATVAASTVLLPPVRYPGKYAPGGHLPRGVNVALGKPGYQTSTRWDGPADRAVDGNTDGNYYVTPLLPGSCTHTAGWGETDPSWRVDLGLKYKVDSVVIFNRMDCCSERLNPFNIHIGDSDQVSENPKCGGDYHIDVNRPSISVPCQGIRGRYVGVRLPGHSRVLTLCEVRVFTATAELWGAKPSVTTSQIRRFTAHYLEPWSELNSDPEP
ncbi:hypothetical protein Bbelb_038040 [Branchiostoma belcheri]|nr:hypothetical protein Bbelb_038040 [Branchiostoma belcheri]